MQSYNSYGGLSKKDTIVKILEEEQRPLSPKEISWISKKEKRFKPLNHSTVKVYCRQLVPKGKINQPIYGLYEVTKDRYGVSVPVRVHDLRLVWEVDVRECVACLDDVVGGVKINCQVGSVRGKVSATIACDEGMDFHTVCFAVDRVKRFAWEKAGVNLDVFQCEVCCEFNEDYAGWRVEGFKCLTVKSFLGDLERIYNKQDCLRSEVKIAKTDLNSVYTLLKGGVSSYNILHSQFMLMKKLDRIAFLLEQSLKRK